MSPKSPADAPALRPPAALWLGPALWPGLGLLLVYAFVYLQAAGALAAFPYDWDQGEGYDAWSAWLLDRGQWPYSLNETFPYYSSNYPPVWSYVVSVPMAWTGPGLAPARLVSTLAGLGAALVVGLAARRRAGSGLAGLLAGGLFLASPYVFHTAPLARVNSLTLLLAVLAVSAFERPTQQRVALGTSALLAALFSKQTAADAAVACLVSALLVAPRRGVAAAVVLASTGVAGLALLNGLTGGAFWLNVVAGNANPFEAGQLLAYLANFTLLHWLIAALAGWEIMRAVRRREWSPWVVYGMASFVAALGVAKVGAGESYFLGLVASWSVLASARFVALARAGEMGARPALVRARHLALGAALLLQGLTLAHGPVTAPPLLADRGMQAERLGRAPTPEDRRAGDEIVALLRRQAGPVLAEDPSFAVAAGKPVVANATHLRNLYDAGLWDAAGLVADLQARRYATVILNAQLYPQPVLEAIGRSYYLARSVRLNAVTYQVFLPGAE